jgi:hypothetical protein
MKLAVKYHSGREPTVSVTGTKEDMLEIAKSISEGIARLEKEEKKEGCLAAGLPSYGDAVEYLEFHAVADVEPLIRQSEVQSKKKAAWAAVLIAIGLAVVFFAFRGLMAILQ